MCTRAITALDSLVDRYGGKVYWLAMDFTGNADDAERVLRRTFLRIRAYVERSGQSDVSPARLGGIVCSEVFALLRAGAATEPPENLEAQLHATFQAWEFVGKECRQAGSPRRQ